MVISISLIIASILGVLISYLLWRKYGDDEPIVKVECNKPPRGYNSAELGFFQKGQSIPEDIMTLLIGLANKGYLKIKEYYETTLFVKERSFKIVKLKDYDGNNEYEKVFLEGLFRYKTEVSIEDLDKSFYLILQRIEKKLESKKNTKLIFEESGAVKGKIVFFIGLIVLIATLVIPVCVLYGKSRLSLAIALVIFEIIGFMALKIIPEYDLNKKSNVFLVILMILVFIFFMMIPVRNMISALGAKPLYLITYFVGLISFAVILFIRIYMSKRTKFGTEILGEIEGFSECLENISNEELEKKIKENLLYYYEMLPYTYVLGISKKWIEKSKEICIQKPEWYESENDINLEVFNHFIESTMSIAITREPYFKPIFSKQEENNK